MTGKYEDELAQQRQYIYRKVRVVLLAQTVSENEKHIVVAPEENQTFSLGTFENEELARRFCKHFYLPVVESK